MGVNLVSYIEGGTQTEASENRGLMTVYGPKGDEVTVDWTILHNEKLQNLYSVPDIIRMIKSGRTRLVGHVACNGDMRNVCRVLVAKPKKKRTLGRPNCR
jgi:hypothetical protein